MKRDPARKWTDRRLAQIERELTQIYADATPEIEEEWFDYMQEPDELERLHDDYVNSSLEDKKQAKEEYKQGLMAFLILSNEFRRMVADTTMKLANTNQSAVNLVNRALPGIYSHNYNYVNPSAVQYMSVLRSSHAIEHLIGDIVTGKQLNIVKDITWNSQMINSAVLQGILRGESIPKISDRIFPLIHDPKKPSLIDKNRNAAVRTARTMITGVENRGRYDRYQEYEEEGLITHKIWLATPDGRTRAWHLDIDGQEVPVNEPFIDGHGNELDYPGDEMAEPETVYNCRCSMKSVLVGVKGKDGKIREVKRFSEMSLHERQITEEKARRAGVQMNPLED